MGKRRESRGRYSRELAELEELRKLDKIMKKESIEGLFLSNASKDSETIRDTVVEDILDKYRIGKDDQRDIDTIERLASGERIVQKTRKVTRVHKPRKAARVHKPKKRAKSAVKRKQKKRFKVRRPSIHGKKKKTKRR
jgi:vacuolar-type H+-ATPase subunit I/STV1